MNEVKDFEVVGEDIEMVILYNNNKIAEVKEEEIENWIANDVFDSVDNGGQRYMWVRGIITEGERRNKVNKRKANSERL